MNMIRSECNKMFSVRLNKISLSPMDTKRGTAENGVTTLAYGDHTVPGKNRDGCIHRPVVGRDGVLGGGS